MIAFYNERIEKLSKLFYNLLFSETIENNVTVVKKQFFLFVLI